jgi:hypothetical protein
MQRSSWIAEHLMGGPITFSYWRGELNELLQALRKRDWENVLEEWSDVGCMTTLVLFQWGLDLPMFWGRAACKKFAARVEIWKGIFAAGGGNFFPKYTVNGGNFRKEHKVLTALQMALDEGQDIDVEACLLYARDLRSS